MIPLSPRARTWGIVGLLVLTAGAVVGWRLITRTRPTTTTQTNTNQENASRQRYAAFADALWRQDEGRGDTLVTATLLVPPMIAALGADSARSDAEDQLYRAVRDLTDQQVAVFLTVDSVGGSVADATIQSAGRLTSDPSDTYIVSTWQPFIATSRLVNAPPGTSSQTGVIVWQAIKPVPWTDLKLLQLTISSIGDTAHREFSWSEPRLLLNIE